MAMTIGRSLSRTLSWVRGCREHSPQAESSHPGRGWASLYPNPLVKLNPH